MAKTWNEGAPDLSNEISADVPDTEENMEFLSMWTKGRRSVFTYNGGTTAYTIKCKAASYYCKDKVCWWDAELTTTAIGTPGASDWYYLYLDNSAITSGIEITNSELLWSNTEPAWSDTYAGWYNGDDLCIFAVRTNSGPTNILEFFHDGDLVLFADSILDANGVNPSTTWTDVTLTTPKFATRISATFSTVYVNASSQLEWRTNGQTGTVGHRIGLAAVGNNTIAETPVISDSSQKIEFHYNDTANNTVDVRTNGWFLPIGM